MTDLSALYAELEALKLRVSLLEAKTTREHLGPLQQQVTVNRTGEPPHYQWEPIRSVGHGH